MSERDPRNKGGLFGYEVGYGQVPELKIKELLQEYLPQLVQNLQLPPGSPSQNIIDIDTHGLANEIKPELRELIESQEFLAMCVMGLGALGQKALTQSELTTQEIQNLSKQGRKAYYQRNQQLELLKRTINSLENVTTAISQQTQKIEDVTSAINNQTTAMVDSIDDLGTDIRDLGDAISATARKLTDKIDESNGIALWMHFDNQRFYERRVTKKRKREPVNPKLHIDAKILINQKKYKLAYRLLKDAHEQNSTDPEIWFSLAYCLIKMGKTDQAWEYIVAIVAIAKKGYYTHLLQKLLNDEAFEKVINKINNLI
jgi:thioredoxin-like negative regulator of GroEL